MKTLIFLVLTLAVVSWYLWNWRKTQVEAERARQEIKELRKHQRQEAITPEDMTWPTVGPSTGGDLQEDTVLEEPMMTEIEF